MIAGDTEFFEKLFLFFEYFPREVISMAIKHNHVWFCTNYKHINQVFALYVIFVTYSLIDSNDACYYGRPDCVRELLKRPNAFTNQADKLSNNSIPIHICHMTGEFSGTLKFLRKVLMYRTQWIS